MQKLLHVLIFLAIGNTAIAQLPSYVPTSGLALYLPFNGNANDASVNGNNGTIYGCTPATGKSGTANTAYKFDGVGNYIKVPNSTSISPSPRISLYARIKPQGFYNGSCRVNMLMSKGFLASGAYLLCYQPSNNYSNSCAFVDSTHENYNGSAGTSGTPYATLDNAPFIQKDLWDDVVFTYDSSTAKMYVNGVKRFQVSYTTGIGTNTNDLFIGKFNNPGFEYWFNGIIDEMGIWNRALSACEINRLYYGLTSYVAANPINQSTTLGNNAVFTVSSGLPTGSVRYRWQSHNGSTYYDLWDGGQYSGVTTNTLTVSGVTPANSNQLFRCFISDTSGCKQDTTTSAVLNITNLSVGHQQAFESYLAQNVPNPAHGSSEIDYYIAGTTHQAEIMVCDMVGRKVQTRPIALSGKGSITIGGLPDGSYCYSLILDGLKIATKRMQVVN